MGWFIKNKYIALFVVTMLLIMNTIQNFLYKVLMRFDQIPNANSDILFIPYPEKPLVL